jgi:hypothetical protein
LFLAGFGGGGIARGAHLEIVQPFGAAVEWKTN